MKEVHSNTYFLSLYYITKLSIELPLMLFSVIVSNLIVYTVVGLRNDLEHCLLFSNFLDNLSVCCLSNRYSGIYVGNYHRCYLQKLQHGHTSSPFIDDAHCDIRRASCQFG